MSHAASFEISRQWTLAPSSFVRNPASVFLASHQAISPKNLIPGYQQFRSSLLKKYSRSPYAKMLEAAFQDIDAGQLFVFDAIALRDTPGLIQLYAFHQKTSPGLLLPEHSIGIAREIVNFNSTDFIKACLLYTAMKPYGEEKEISELILELYPEVFIDIDGVSLEVVFTRQVTVHAFEAAEAAGKCTASGVLSSEHQSERLSFQDWLIAGLGGGAGRYLPRSIHEIRSLLKRAFSEQKGDTAPAIMQAVLTVLLEPQNQARITERHLEQLISLTSEVELPLAALEYIGDYLNRHEDLNNDLIQPAQIRVIQTLLQILCAQAQFGSSFEYIRIRSLISRWAYYPNGLKDIKKTAETLIEKMDKTLGERLNRNHGSSNTLSLRDKISAEWTDGDINQFHEKYEFREDVSIEAYRAGFRQVYSSIVEALLDPEKDLLRKSNWLLQEGKILDVSSISAIHFRYVGEGGAKIAFVAEIVLNDGDVSHIVFKGIKPFEVQFKKNKFEQIRKGLVQEVYRHQYMSGYPNTSIFGVSAALEGFLYGAKSIFLIPGWTITSKGFQPGPLQDWMNF
jgi:hypothetical protein